MHLGTRRALCAIVVAAAPVLVAAQDAPASDVPEVRTSATATRGVRPDLATVTLQFAASGRTPREAGAHVAMRADSLRRAIGAIGIPKDSLVSRAQWGWWPTRIEIIPQPVRYPPPAPNAQWVAGVQDTMYRAHDAIEVRIRDLSKIGAVIDTAMAHRITEISPVRFSATDVSAVRDILLGEATKRARQQAEAIAAASGSQLGRVRSLSTQGDFAPRYEWGISVGGPASIDRNDAGTSIVQPATTVSVTVYGRWELISRP